MYIKKIFLYITLCLLLFTANGCVARSMRSNDKEQEDDNSKLTENKQVDGNETGSSQSVKETQEEFGNSISEKKNEIQKDDDEDDELEQSLTEYRKERETMTNVKMGSGLIGFGAPNLEDYGIDDRGTKYLSEFDAREKGKAFEAAEKYITETLGIEVETKATVYMCVDPRIYKIYEDKEKGVAEGYDNENIFVCEYLGDEVWQYLILVRDSKEDPWIVIHHGSSYKE